MKRFFILLTALLLLLLSSAALGEGFEGFDGVIIIGTDGPSHQDEDAREGLQTRITDTQVTDEGNGYAKIVVKLEATNWTLDTLIITENLSSSLLYAGMYRYDAQLSFDRVSIGMMERVSGSLTFRVPYIVALAGQDDLEITIRALKDAKSEPLNLKSASAALRSQVSIPFQVANAAQPLELALGGVTLLDRWGNETSESQLWIAVDAQLINWDLNEQRINRKLSVSLVYKDVYYYDAILDFKQTELDSLFCVSGRLVFKVPYLVLMADEKDIVLEAKIAGSEESFPLDLTKVTRELREEAAMPFDFDKAQSSFLEILPGNAEVLLSYQGQSDDIARFILLDITVVNWDTKPILLDEDALKAYVICYGKYGFPGVFEYPQRTIAPLEFISCRLAVRVPTTAVEASREDIELWVTGTSYEYRSSLDLSAKEESSAASTWQIKGAIKAGDIVTFGRYQQDIGEDAVPREIQWIVLETDDEKNACLLLSIYVLDSAVFTAPTLNVSTWGESSMCQWLNGDFLNAAFSSDEQASIIVTNIFTHCRPRVYNITKDRVFLLSQEEVDQYFPDRSSKKALGTEYAKTSGTLHLDAICSWASRSPHSTYQQVAEVNYYGVWSYPSAKTKLGVRPALWVNADSPYLQKSE